jgi:hypothetical protein
MTLRRALLRIRPAVLAAYARERGLYLDTAREELLDLLDGAVEREPATPDRPAGYRVRRRVGGAEIDISARVVDGVDVVAVSVRTGPKRRPRSTEARDRQRAARAQRKAALVGDIRERRLALDLTVADAARCAGVTPDEWAAVEAQQTANRDTLDRMAGAVGLVWGKP